MTTTLSPRKIEANRLNAQKSTGPKTPAGKAISRLNARKHSLLSRQIVAQGYKITESSRDFKNLYREYHDHLAPVGPIEEMLVDQIIATIWRLRRVRTAETGEVTLSVDGGWQSRKQLEDMHLLWHKWLAFGDVSENMARSYFGNKLMQAGLMTVYEAVDRDGELTNATLKELIKEFGGKPNSLTDELKKLCGNHPVIPNSPDAAALRGKNKAEILAWLDAKMEHLSVLAVDFQQRDLKNEAANQAAQTLPATETLDKIIRYENSLSRQLFQAMDQLERLQRRRLGENVPPPMIIGVSAERLKLPNEPTAKMIDVQ
jgi:hypothetical protein